MATKKTMIVPADRYDLIEMLRPLADVAPDRCNLTDLAVKGVDHIEGEVKGDPLLGDWYERTRRGALADRIYAELSILLKAKQLNITLPFMKQPIPINPRQGVRVPGMKEYQQTLFLAFTWDEYDAWCEDQVTRYNRAAKIREMILLINRVRMLHPNVKNIAQALKLGGATIEAEYDEADAA